MSSPLVRIPRLDRGALCALYEGKILVLHRLPAMLALCEHAERLVVRPYSEAWLRWWGLRSNEGRHGAGFISEGEEERVVRHSLIEKFEEDARTRQLFVDLFQQAWREPAEAGDDVPDTTELGELYWDRPRIRVQPVKFVSRGSGSAFRQVWRRHAKRDRIFQSRNFDSGPAFFLSSVCSFGIWDLGVAREQRISSQVNRLPLTKRNSFRVLRRQKFF